MGRHRTAQEKQELGEQARALRAAGRSRREIQAELGIGDDLAKALLHGVPLPDALRRPRAKDDLREAALEMRRAGATYDEIAADLGVAKSTCSLWLRGLPHPGDEDVAPPDVELPAPAQTAEAAGRRETARRLRLEGVLLRDIAAELGVSAKTAYSYTWDLPVPAGVRRGGDADHMHRMRRRYWDRVLAERQAERDAMHERHAARIGRLTPRELEIAAVVAYWCEGSKSKTYNRREQVTFINSDPGLVLLWLAYLDDIDFPATHRRFSLSIHESADVAGAHGWWSDVIRVPVCNFSPAYLKRHNASTVRKNTEQAYVGCLAVRLVQCRTLYQRIDGVWQGIMGGLPQGGAEDLSRVV